MQKDYEDIEKMDTAQLRLELQAERERNRKLQHRIEDYKHCISRILDNISELINRADH